MDFINFLSVDNSTGWLIGILSAAGSTVLSLTVSYLFNYFTGLPKKIKAERDADKKEKQRLMEENRDRDEKIQMLQEAVDALPGYRQQSLAIQQRLQNADVQILDTCAQIKESIIQTNEEVIRRLNHLEEREKNALRAKILDEFRLYTDEAKNPLGAWSEMEQHSFFELVKDYESLGGNDYVHSVVIPAMHKLNVINMQDRVGLKELYDSRKI